MFIFKFKVFTSFQFMMKISEGQSVTKWIARCQEALKTVHLGVIHQGI